MLNKSSAFLQVPKACEKKFYKITLRQARHQRLVFGQDRGVLEKVLDKSGFTLIESMIAISILILVVIFMVTFFPLGLKYTKRSAQQTIGVFLAQAKLEEIISTPYEELAAGQTTENSLVSLDDDFAAYSRETTISNVDGNLADSFSDVGLKKINVKVSWYDDLNKAMASTTLTTLTNAQ